MTFDELRDKIKEYPDKTNYIPELRQLSYNADNFYVISALYNNDRIELGCVDDDEEYCELKTEKDVYKNMDIINPQIKNNPYYILVDVETISKKTIDIINNLDENAYVNIVTRWYTSNFELLSEINHNNILITFSGAVIDLNEIYSLSQKYDIEFSSVCDIVINNFDNDTYNKLTVISKKVKIDKYRVNIKTKNDLEVLINIEEFIPVNTFIEVDHELFSMFNPNNARDLLATNKDIDDLLNNRYITFLYEDIEYNSFNQIIDLERNIDLIKMRIPYDASKLDKVTYVSLFMINYFQYDYDLVRKQEEEGNDFKDVNPSEVVKSGKGVCRHFASLTKKILNSLGVECECITAYDKNYEEGHVFNVVTIDGKSYFLDNTWLIDSIKANPNWGLTTSKNFLRSNHNFGHEEYRSVISDVKIMIEKRLMILY